jgi:signal transduction histidine kinase
LINAKPSSPGIPISDTGPGIPEDQRVRVFERFSQLNRTDRQSLGLGLYIAKSIVEAHGGRIWVDTAVGATVFYVTLVVP